jgi:hypothetical protein
VEPIQARAPPYSFSGNRTHFAPEDWDSFLCFEIESPSTTHHRHGTASLLEIVRTVTSFQYRDKTITQIWYGSSCLTWRLAQIRANTTSTSSPDPLSNWPFSLHRCPAAPMFGSTLGLEIAGWFARLATVEHQHHYRLELPYADPGLGSSAASRRFRSSVMFVMDLPRVGKERQTRRRQLGLAFPSGAWAKDGNPPRFARCQWILPRTRIPIGSETF